MSPVFHRAHLYFDSLILLKTARDSGLPLWADSSPGLLLLFPQELMSRHPRAFCLLPAAAPMSGRSPSS